MYQLLGICVIFAALLTINAFASIAAAGVWRAFRTLTGGLSAQTRAQIIFSLRTLPPFCAVVCVAAFLLPAYLIYEPQNSVEIVGFKLGILAFISMCGAAFAVWRGIASQIATRKLLNEWLKTAQSVSLDGIRIPAFSIEHSFPVIAIVGAFRPRLFIARQLFDVLDEDELCAAIQHENGHLAARDTFKNVALRACSDVLSIVPCGRLLDRAWREESEIAADEYAADITGNKGALSLASALVKIARIVPSAAKPEIAASAFLIEQVGDTIAKRIRRLVQLSEIAAPNRKLSPQLSFAAPALLLGAFLAAVIFFAAQSATQQALHLAIEHFVYALQ